MKHCFNQKTYITNKINNHPLINKGKVNLYNLVFEDAKILKNLMSEFILSELKQHNFSKQIFSDLYNNSYYSQFNSSYLSNWQLQNLFQEVLITYKNKYKQRTQFLNFSLFDKSIITYYKRNTKLKKKGDLKSYKVKRKQTTLTKMVKYLSYIEDIYDTILLN